MRHKMPWAMLDVEAEEVARLMYFEVREQTVPDDVLGQLLFELTTPDTFQIANYPKPGLTPEQSSAFEDYARHRAYLMAITSAEDRHNWIVHPTTPNLWYLCVSHRVSELYAKHGWLPSVGVPVRYARDTPRGGDAEGCQTPRTNGRST